MVACALASGRLHGHELKQITSVVRGDVAGAGVVSCPGLMLGLLVRAWCDRLRTLADGDPTASSLLRAARSCILIISMLKLA